MSGSLPFVKTILVENIAQQKNITCRVHTGNNSFQAACV